MKITNRKKELLLGIIVSFFSTILIYIVLFILSGFLLISALFDYPNNIFLQVAIFLLSLLAYFTLPGHESSEDSIKGKSSEKTQESA
ncbi:MAG: hypothetical protein ACTSP4_10455 [Candidatus Hodarchaeales archaeon]